MSFHKLDFKEITENEMKNRSQKFYYQMKSRRTVRDFSGRSVPLEILESCIKTAGLAPSGANKQPWSFVLVQDPDIKKKIRFAAEAEEKEEVAPVPGGRSTTR